MRKLLIVWGVILSTGWVEVSSAVAGSQFLSAAHLKSAQQGYTLLEQGLVNQAIPLFEAEVRQNPQSLEATLGLATAYQRAGKDEPAFRTYQQVLAIAPDNVPALTALGTLGGYRPEWQNQGIEALSRLLKKNPQDVPALTQRALLYTYQGRFGEAVADYALVLQRNPAPATLQNAAEAYIYSGNYSQGLALFDRYQASGRSIQGTAAIAYALAAREGGNPALAVQVLEANLARAQTMDSVTVQQLGALSASYAANGQLDQGAAVLAPLQGRADARLTLARAYNELWRYSRDRTYATQAATLYQDVLAQPSSYVTVGIAREVAYALAGLPDQQTVAREVYRQLLTERPEDAGLGIQLAMLEHQLGNLSLAQLQQAVLRYAQPLPEDALQQRQIAQGLVRLDPPEASLLELYRALLNLGVNEPLLSYRIAQIYANQEQFDQARAALLIYAKTVTAGTSGFDSGLLLLADIERRAGNLPKSVEIYDAVLLNQPTDATILTAALQGYAEVLEAQGQNRAALALYDQYLAQSPQPAVAILLHRTRIAYEEDVISQAAARSLLEQVIAQQVAVTEADYFALGELAMQIEAWETAEQVYDALSLALPENVSGLSALAGLRYEQQRYQDAIDLYRQVLTVDPSNSTAQTALSSLSQGFLNRRGFQPAWERY